ncbi:hypothetical protein [Prescottella equi]|uniref:hypothetical protein n=1 Tax=Rhodococcus hoagii TaxID=43767 RepID=UPI00384B5355
MSEDDCEQAVRDRFPILDKLRIESPGVFEPAPGSELELDDQDWIPSPLSQSAYKAFTAALDHLQAVRVQLDRPKPQLFPFAQLSLCRPALLASSLVVWMLTPNERQERCHRHRISIADELRNHEKFLSELSDGAPDHASTRSVLDHVQSRLKEMNAKLGIEGKRDWDRLRESSTNQIGIAADALGEHLARGGSIDAAGQLAHEVKLSWRATSGAAHGLTWQIAGTDSLRQAGAPDEHGRAVFVAGGSFAQLANHYCAALEMAKFSWELLRARGGK